MNDLPKMKGTTPRGLADKVKVPQKVKTPEPVKDLPPDGLSPTFNADRLDTRTTGREKWNAFWNYTLALIGKTADGVSNAAVLVKGIRSTLIWLVAVMLLGLIIFALFKAGIF